MPHASPLYFPVNPAGIDMGPGLYRLGHDFGNGVLDSQLLQADHNQEQILREKRCIMQAHPQRCWLTNDASASRVLDAVLTFLQDRAQTELGCALGELPAPLEARAQLLCLALCEDFAVLHAPDRSPPGESLISAHICFPGGFRPEALKGQSFTAIHAPVPRFPAGPARAAIVQAMFSKGPYVRFVWTLSPDPLRDHHPDTPRPSLATSEMAYFRVERQVTVPFPELRAALFTIRTYIYSLDELTSEQRQRLCRALLSSSEDVLKYKGLLDARPKLITLLRPDDPNAL